MFVCRGVNAVCLCQQKWGFAKWSKHLLGLFLVWFKGQAIYETPSHIYVYIWYLPLNLLITLRLSAITKLNLKKYREYSNPKKDQDWIWDFHWTKGRKRNIQPPKTSLGGTKKESWQLLAKHPGCRRWLCVDGVTSRQQVWSQVYKILANIFKISKGQLDSGWMCVTHNKKPLEISLLRYH